MPRGPRVDLRWLSFREIDASLRRYAIELLIIAAGGLAALFRDWFIGLLRDAASDLLAQIVFWSALVALSAVALFALYFYRSRVLEREILKLDPNFYEHYTFNKAFDDAAKKS